jgi:hypothetical protein
VRRLPPRNAVVQVWLDEEGLPSRHAAFRGISIAIV